MKRLDREQEQTLDKKGEHTKEKTVEVVGSSSSNGRQQNPKTSPEMVQVDGGRKRRRLGKNWKDTATDDFKIMNMNQEEAIQTEEDRKS